ncbi:CDP-alcohol phosphatidyltransferase family protein [Rhodosalinus sediminis]|uniref:CDP-alcohol phosphatidyltransferase family protein n=1 Tax=Rhodosalinus sediminis TaxID=1940533 RepID=A0A3D9BU74_9RHOB|nr:CDP-alcohol phosphatidyltransferase family protein [Rhodosalinus sediminis]REC57074.1 CDP-alcohol phosphatidyltransferase family protein [Rhodosalinus sediminis]
MTQPGTDALVAARAAEAPAAAQFAAVAAGWFALLAGALALWPGAVPAPVWIGALAAHLGVSAAAGAGLARGYPHRALGLCNAVTHLRATGALFLAAALLTGPTPAQAWGLTALAAATLALDGVDGWLARRRGLVSGFGARFDVETDALVALVLAGAAVAAGKIGPAEAAILGAARYLFLAAGAVAPWLAAPLPERTRRKAICVVQIAVLTALLAPPVEGRAATLAGLGAAALVAGSFAIDIRALWRARRRR